MSDTAPQMRIPFESRERALARGLVAGALGTAALEALEPVERRIGGPRLPFTPRAIARALLTKVRGRRPERRSVARLGKALRWTYGPAWGVAGELARRRRDVSGTMAAVLFGGAIFGFEMLLLPIVVGRRRFYRRRTLLALALHVASFAAVTSAARSVLLVARRRAGAERRKAKRASHDVHAGVLRRKVP